MPARSSKSSKSSKRSKPAERARPASRSPRAKSSAKGPADPLIEFCRALPGATEDVKWGNDLIFSVGGKMFAGMPLPDCEPVSFRVDPVVFEGMTGHNGVIPAPYMARHHWVSVTDRSKLPAATLRELIAESHRLVAEKLPRKTRAALGL